MAEKSVRKAMQLLEILADSETPIGVSEISRRMAWTKSGTHRLLTTFTELGYVRQIEENQLYQLSNRLLQLASSSVHRLDLRQESILHLKNLLTLTQETARLTILAGDTAVCIEQLESNHPVTVQTQVGGSLSLGMSATGKAILAWADEELVDRVAAGMEAYTETTLVPAARLKEDLAVIRERGYAINNGERHRSVSGIGAPVFDRLGRVEAAIGISGPSERVTLDFMQHHGDDVRKAAAALSAELGWSPQRRELLAGSAQA